MTPAQAAASVAIYAVPSVAVAVLNPLAREHLGAIGTGVFVGGLAGRLAVNFLPVAEQTTTNDLIGAILGSFVGGVSAYAWATRGERRENPVRVSGVGKRARRRR